jgi:serine/threonine protein phosphatase PrpC
MRHITAPLPLPHTRCSGQRYGTTAVAALRIGGAVYIAHAGDSRAVRGLSSAAPSVYLQHACIMQ